jgi:hypothetical protein
MIVNERQRFELMMKRNQDLALRASNPTIRTAHEAWANFYKRLAGMAA